MLVLKHTSSSGSTEGSFDPPLTALEVSSGVPYTHHSTKLSLPNLKGNQKRYKDKITRSSRLPEDSPSIIDGLTSIGVSYKSHK